jgi:hypothetical protein
MPIEVHATRAKRWFENEGCEIAPAEWRALVAADPELAPPGPHEAAAASGELARWDGHPDGEPRWLWLHEGTVSIRDPDEITIEKLAELAARLGARVQGDDGHPLSPPRSARRRRGRARGRLRRAWVALTRR